MNWVKRTLVRSSPFSFLVFGHFRRQSYENTKILCNLCLHFARQDGQDGKKRKENQANKVNKIPKTKRQKYGMNNRPNNINCTVSLSKVVGRGFTQFSINMYG